MEIIYRAADIGTVVRIRAEINGVIFYSKEEFDTLDAAREYISKHLPQGRKGKKMKKYMVKTMDSGRAKRKYFKTLAGATKYFENCGGAVLYEYNAHTLTYEYINAR